MTTSTYLVAKANRQLALSQWHDRQKVPEVCKELFITT